MIKLAYNQCPRALDYSDSEKAITEKDMSTEWRSVKAMLVEKGSEDLVCNLIAELALKEDELPKNSQALDTATALRTKELAEFNAEEKESLQTISSLKSAIIALSKHHEAALVQSESSESAMNFLKVPVMLQQLVQKHGDMFTPKQKRSVNAFVQTATVKQAPAS